MDITVDGSYSIALRKSHEVFAKIVNNCTSKNIWPAPHGESIHKNSNDPLLENHVELMLQRKVEITDLNLV